MSEGVNEQHNSLEQAAAVTPTNGERLDTTRLPEKVPPKVFSDWVSHLKTNLPEFLPYIAQHDLEGFLASAKPIIQDLTTSARQTSEARGNGKRQAFNWDGIQSMLEDDKNVMRLVRNGLNAVVIDKVTSDFSEALVIDTPTDGVEISLALPTNRKVEVWDGNTAQGEELLNKSALSVQPETFGLTSAEVNKGEYEKNVWDVIEKNPHLFEDKAIQTTYAFADDYKAVRVPIPDETKVQNTTIVVSPEKNTGPSMEFSIDIFKKYGDFFLRSSDGFSMPPSAAASRVMIRLFEEYADSWRGSPADTIQSQEIVSFLDHTFMSFRSGEAVGLHDTFETPPDISFESIKGGFTTGVDQFRRLIELHERFNALKDVVEKEDELKKFSNQAAENTKHSSSTNHDFNESIHQLNLRFANGEYGVSLAEALEAYAKLVAKGDLDTIKTSSLYQTPLRITNGPQTIAQFFDYTLSKSLSAFEGKYSVGAEKLLSSAIPLSLAHLHLDILGGLLQGEKDGITAAISPTGMNEATAEFIADAANRPDTVATGCPAIPGGVITKQGKVFGKIYELFTRNDTIPQAA